MSFFRKIKSLFIVEENIDSSGNETAEKKPFKTGAVSESASETQKFLDILISAIEKNNLEGFDYLEFMQSIDNIRNQDLTEDESKIYQTAFAIASTLGVDKSKLIESGRFYLGILEKEKSHFNDALNNNAKKRLKDRLSDLKKAEKTNDDFNKQLEELRKNIAEKESEINSLKAELTEADAKIRAVQLGFSKAHEAMKAKIQEDLNKIEKFL